MPNFDNSIHFLSLRFVWFVCTRVSGRHWRWFLWKGESNSAITTKKNRKNTYVVTKLNYVIEKNEWISWSNNKNVFEKRKKKLHQPRKKSLPERADLVALGLVYLKGIKNCIIIQTLSFFPYTHKYRCIAELFYIIRFFLLTICRVFFSDCNFFPR